MATTKSLLAVDDDPSILMMVSLIFKPLVPQLWTSTDPHEGLRLAMMHKPSVILLDNHMGDMLGIEVLRQLRRMPNTARIPVLMMTADSSLDTVQVAAQQQVQGYLLKPCDPEILLETLAPWLDLPYRRHSHVFKQAPRLPEQQTHRLELQSLLNVLQLIEHELGLLIQLTADPEGLKACWERLEIVRETLLLQDFELLARLDSLEPLFKRQLSSYQSAHPELESALPMGSFYANLNSLLRILQHRAQSLPERQKLSWTWLSESALREQLSYPLEALAFNQPDRYLTRYDQLPDLLRSANFELEIQAESASSIWIPCVLIEMINLLLANAFGQSQPQDLVRVILIVDQKQLKLSVTDSGRGLPAAELPKIVEYGYRGPGSPEANFGGLGLTRVWQLAHQLKGKLSVATDLGVGTRVSLELPLFS